MGGSNEEYAFSSVQETATVEPKNARVLSTAINSSCNCHQLLMTCQTLSLVPLRQQQHISSIYIHIPFSSYCIHMALRTSNFLKVLLHACYHPHLPVSFLCFAVKAGHWFPPDSKDHTHRLGVPAFSKKSSKVNIRTRFAAPKLLQLLVLSSLQRIAFHKFV